MTRLLLLGTIVGPVLFTTAWVVLGVVSPGYTMWDIVVPSYSAVAQPISGLGLGVTGPVMNAAFIVGGLLLLVGILGVARSIPELSSRARWTYTALLALAPIGMMLDGVFTLESFFPHFAGYLVATCGSVVSFFVVGRALRRIPRWRPLGSALRLGSALTLLLLVVAQVTFDPTTAGANIGVGGLTERILVTELLGWFVVMGITSMRLFDAASVVELRAAA